MDVSKKISAYPEKFFTLILVCIDALRAVMYMDQIRGEIKFSMGEQRKWT